MEIGATPRLIAMSECARWIATVEGDDAVRLWNRTTSASAALPRRSGSKVSRLSFYPDCSTLIVHYQGAATALWNLSVESPTEKPALGTGSLVAMSDDGRWMVRTDGEAVGRVWDTTNTTAGKPLALHHHSPFFAVSRDGQHVAVADDQHVLSLYDITADGWHETDVTLPASFDDPVAEQFSLDGRRLLLFDSDGDICICDTAKGRLAMPMLRTHTPLTSVRFVGDRRLVTVSRSGLIRVWELPSEAAGSTSATPDERPVIDLVRIAQLLAGAKIDPSQKLEPLSPAELQANWNEKPTAP
jgi:WD40 repeat protein